jgi:small neutral amino acid transporter SnatA (MarC family)
MHVPPGIFSSFITLLVTIGPIETAVVFASLTAGIHHSERISPARRSVTIAAFVPWSLQSPAGSSFRCCIFRCPHSA